MVVVNMIIVIYNNEIEQITYYNLQKIFMLKSFIQRYKEFIT